MESRDGLHAFCCSVVSCWLDLLFCCFLLDGLVVCLIIAGRICYSVDSDSCWLDLGLLFLLVGFVVILFVVPCCERRK